MRYPIAAAVLALAATALADPGEIALTAIGLPFAPEAPAPVAATHPLYQRIEIAEIEGLPPTVKSSALNFIAAAKRSSINAGLTETFRQMHLLAPDAAAARFRLAVRWGGSETPFHIGSRNTATATFHYRLARIDTGQVLFDRDVITSMKGGGVDASMRDNGVVRGAIATNFASAANCLDHAAFGTAPADCALTPKFSVLIVREPRR
jgi:hypothetical protein